MGCVGNARITCIWVGTFSPERSDVTVVNSVLLIADATETPPALSNCASTGTSPVSALRSRVGPARRERNVSHVGGGVFGVGVDADAGSEVGADEGAGVGEVLQESANTADIRRSVRDIGVNL